MTKTKLKNFKSSVSVPSIAIILFLRWKQPQNFLQGFSNNCVYQKAHIVETFQKS